VAKNRFSSDDIQKSMAFLWRDIIEPKTTNIFSLNKKHPAPNLLNLGHKSRVRLRNNAENLQSPYKFPGINP